MSLELRSIENQQISDLWTAWKVNPNSELEATFKSLDLNSWLNIVQHLRSIGLKEEPQPPKLNIMAAGLRFSIVGEKVVQEFCKDNKIHDKKYHVILKEKQRGDGTHEVDLKEYGVRIKARRELPLQPTHPRVLDVISRWATIPKSFRYIKRYSFTSLQHKGIQFDLSLVRHNFRGPRGDYIQSSTFQHAKI